MGVPQLTSAIDSRSKVRKRAMPVVVIAISGLRRKARPKLRAEDASDLFPMENTGLQQKISGNYGDKSLLLF